MRDCPLHPERSHALKYPDNRAASVPLHVPSAAELRATRLRLGLTQSEVAKAAGVSQPLIARMENESVDARLSTFRAVVDALNRAERTVVTLKDVMHAPVDVVRATDTMAEAIRLMREKSYSQVPVIAKGIPVGSLSERAVVHALAGARDAEALARAPVRDSMGPPFPTASPETSVDQAARLLEDQSALLVMERGKLLGIVSKADLLSLIK